MYNALKVAQWFIVRNEFEKASGDGEDLTLLKLLKLLYYAEGCSLALDNGSLFEDNIIAWEHGPVVPSVYHHYSADPFHLPCDEEAESAAKEIAPKDAQILEMVYNVFGQYSAWGLRNMTHQEKPWKDATHNGAVLNGIIDRQTMKEYFKENYIEQ